MTAKRRKRAAQAEPATELAAARGDAANEPVAGTAPADDTALCALTRVERARLGMDSWEPSLLRELLQAENRLPTDKG